MKILLAASAAVLWAGAAHAAPDFAAKAAEEALAADRAFAARAQVVSPAQAFREFMDGEEGLLFGTGGEPAKGGEAIYRLMGGDAPPKVRMEWTPKSAWGAASGDFAVTVGDWTRTWLDGSRGPLTGNYVTVWRKTQAGWKGLIDIGEVDAPAKPPAPAPGR